MDPSSNIRANFGPDAFSGTADYYVKYRPPYPEVLLADLRARSAVTGGGLLLDLACGPGRVALDLAGSFGSVWAVDLEPEMIAAGRREAARRGMTNITWRMGRVEDLEAPGSAFDLITIGEAFHRLEKGPVARRCLRWLKPGCCLATLGSFTIISAREAWQRVVLEVMGRWTNRGRNGARGFAPGNLDEGPRLHERVMREEGFVEVATHPFVVPREWTIEAIIGYLYSTSVCSRNVLGGNVEAFESDLRASLMEHDPGGAYRENLQWGYTLGRKPT